MDLNWAWMRTANAYLNLQSIYTFYFASWGVSRSDFKVVHITNTRICQIVRFCNANVSHNNWPTKVILRSNYGITHKPPYPQSEIYADFIKSGLNPLKITISHIWRYPE